MREGRVARDVLRRQALKEAATVRLFGAIVSVAAAAKPKRDWRGRVRVYEVPAHLMEHLQKQARDAGLGNPGGRDSST